MIKATTDTYILRFRNHKLFVVTLAVLSVFPLSGQQFTVGQEVHKRDTLLYYWHNAINGEYPDLIPEDCYMELYIGDGILEKGFFWGTTDEFDTGREGYECGYFILPMTEIRHEKDSISFKLSLIKTEHGENVNNFVKAPVDKHIRSWQEALSRYQTWDYISGSFDKEIRFSIFFSPKVKKTKPHSFPMEDTITLRNLTIDSGKERTFVLQKRKNLERIISD